jgi:hypothetical protein
MFKKKVVDIMPPKSKQPLVVVQNYREKKEEKRVVREEAEREDLEEETPRGGGLGKGGIIAAFVFLVLIVVQVLCFFFLSKATIEIWPKTETINISTTLTIDLAAKQASFSNKVIPGELFEKSKMVNETFASSGKSEQEGKAEGTIKVYNEYSTAVQPLLATTRFVSTDGKVFRTPTKATIPGLHYENNKMVAGEVEIRVVADQPGPEYNIGPTTFSIPGFAGSEKYVKFYAKSSQSMSGGSTKQVALVTREDLDNAKTVLSKRAKEECLAAFKDALNQEKMPAGYSFIEDGIQTDVTETFSLATAGSQGSNFNYQATAKSKTIIFQQKDLEDFVKSFMETQTLEDKKIDQANLKVKIMPETVNFTSGKMIISLDVSALSYSDINVDSFKKGLAGKTASESRVFLENFSEISNSRVELWPFWVSKVPEDISKMEIKLNIASPISVD